MADKKKSSGELLLENEELKLRLAAKEALLDSFRESEKKYTSVYNSMGEGLAIHELIYDASGKAVDYQITDVNPAYEHIIGVKKKKVVGRLATDVYKVSTAPYLEIYSNVALTGDPQTFETYFPPMDKHFHVSVFSPGEGKFATVFQDISERRRNEEKLQITLNKFYLVLSRMHSGILLITDENKVEFVNQPFCKVFDLKETPDELLNRSADEIISKIKNKYLNPDKEIERIKEIVANSAPVIGEDITMKSGRTFLRDFIPIYVGENNYGRLWSHIDITERKLVEEALAFQSHLLSAVQDAVFSSDINYSITYWNHAAEKIFGWTKEEVLGKKSGELLKPKIENSSPDNERSKLRRAGHWEGEVQFLQKDGKYVFMDVNSTVLKDAGGNETGNVVVARDITERKRAEEALERQSAWLDASISSMATGIILYGLDSKAIRMNDIAKNLLPEELFINKNIEDRSKIIKWKTEDGKPLALDGIPVIRAFKGETTRNVIIGAFINDQMLWISANAAPILAKDGKMMGVVASFLDITESKNAETALRLSEERLRVTLTSIGDAVITVDTSGKVNFLNPVAIKLTGWEHLQAEGQPVQNVFRIINEITQMPAEDIVQKVLGEGRVVGLSNHTSLVTKDGRQIPIEDSAAPIKDPSGNVIGVILVFHDVTEKRRAQEALRESEERFRSLVKNAPTAIYEIDFITRKFITVNDSMCKLSGYSREELLSIDSLKLLDDDSKKLFLSRISKGQKGELLEEDVEYKVIAKDGHIIDAVLNLKFTYNNQGIPFGALVVGHDITQRKHAAEEIRKAGEALKESEMRFRTLAENIPDLIVRFDKDLRLIYGNEAVMNRTGRPLEFLIGKTAKEYGASSETDRNWEKAAREVINSGKPCRLVQANRWQGTSKIYDALIVPEKDNTGRVNSIISIARDITEMKKAENILRTSEQRLKYHLENSPLAVIEWDKEFNIIQWSKEAERIFGLTKEETIGVRIDILNIIYHEDIPIVEKTMSRLTSGKELKVVAQNRNITKTGEVRECIWYNSVLMDEKGNMSSVMSLVEDITLLRQTEKALMESRESYKELVTNARSMIVKLDNEGRFTYINEFALEFFGYKEIELLGESVMIIVPEKDSTGRDLTEMIDNIIEDPDTHFVNINENIKKNGEKVWIEWHNKTLFDQSGKKTGHIAIGIDISKRKKAEAALKESERKLKSVLNAANESIYMFDRGGHILMSNATGIRRLKRHEENQIVGHHFSEFMTPKLAKMRMEKINEVFNTGVALQYEDERNSRFFHHSFYPVTKDDDVLYVVTYSTDITESRNAESNLKQSEDRFRTIAESLTVMVSITRISDSTITFLNEPFEKSFGYKKGEIIGTRMPDIYFHTDDNKFLVDLLKVKGQVENVEVRVKRKNGTPFWIMTSIRKINYMNEPSCLTASIDISETKIAQEELLRLNRTLDAQSKSSQAMMHSKNEQEYLNEICKIIIEDCGHAMVWVGYAQNDKQKSVRPVAHFGFDKGYIERMNITWDDSERGNGPTGTAIKTGKPSICRNMLTDPCFSPWRDEAIQRGYASSVVLPLKSEEKAFGAISIYSKGSDPFTDSEIDLLSELADDLAYGILFIRLSEYEKEATRSIKENETRLKELISTKDKFFNIIAHDLKNPFTSLLGASELLYDNISQMTEENIKKLALILNDSAKGGYAILQNLLDWSRSQTGQLKFNPEKVNLKAIIDENVENLKLQVNNKEIDLKSDLIEDLFITADKNMINTVLRNLLSNAVKYTFKNGLIRVTVEQSSKAITLIVKDTGIGISNEKTDSLFRLENSLSLPGTAKEQGTGLGLKLCKEFTEKMGGRIWVESKIGVGSEFKFTVPVKV